MGLPHCLSSVFRKLGVICSSFEAATLRTVYSSFSIIQASSLSTVADMASIGVVEHDDHDERGGH